MTVAGGSGFRLSAVDFGIMLLLFGCWMVGSAGNIMKYFPSRLLLLYAAGAIGVGITLTWLRWRQGRRDGQVRWSWLAALWILATLLYLILYPISQRHIVGPGSDSEDALRIAAHQILHHHYPYALHTYLGNPISPMPGAVILAIPFELMGRVSLENLCWLGAFVIFCAKFFRLRSTAFAFLLVLVLACPAALHNFVVGADYFTNVWYLCIAVFLFLNTYEKNPAGWRHLTSGIFLGICLSSRPNYPITILPLLLARLSQSRKGSAVAWRSFAVPFLAAAAVTLPFYLYDPAHFSPLHIREKLDLLPSSAESVLYVALPALAFLVAGLGFFAQLTMSRLFLIAGIANGIILLSPALLLAAWNGFAAPGWILLDSGTPAAIFVGLWAFYRFESASPAVRTGQTDAHPEPVAAAPGWVGNH